MEQQLKRINIMESPQPSAEEKQQLSASLLEEPKVKALIKDGYISAKTVMKSPYRLQAWLHALSPCIRCAGLNMCGQKTKGYFMNLIDDGMIREELTPCKYMKTKLKDEAHCANFTYSDISPKYRSIGFSSITARDGGDAYLNTVMKLQDLFEEGKGAYIYGPMGTGKTYLAACAANDAARQGKKCAFLHWPSFTAKMQSLVKTGEWEETVRKMTYVGFLVIDDIGAESISEWNRDQILQPILVYRYEHDLPVWFTSNYDPDTLTVHFTYTKNKNDETGAQRVMERIRHMAEAVPLSGNDRRNTL